MIDGQTVRKIRLLCRSAIAVIERNRTGRAVVAAVRATSQSFGNVLHQLWLEVTGFFFGLFALYFAQDLWRTHLSYASGPQHQRFLIAAAMTLVFGYLSVSAFWRARRR